jgi:hypothetical protein
MDTSFPLDLIQKSTNQQGQKWQLFLLTSSLLYFVCVVVNKQTWSLLLKQTQILIVAATQKVITINRK